jgi:hypothetical protein
MPGSKEAALGALNIQLETDPGVAHAVKLPFDCIYLEVELELHVIFDVNKSASTVSRKHDYIQLIKSFLDLAI